MKIFEIILLIITLITFILVGTPIKYNCTWLNIITILVGIVYIVYKKVIRKEKLFSNKIDIVIMLFCLTPIIPYVFKTYSNANDTLISILKSISLFNIYIISKDIIKINKEYIIDTLIIGSVILVVLGIDEMTSRYLFRYTEYLGIPYVVNYESRMFSTLGYANSFAIIMGVSLFLTIEKTKKPICSGVFFLLLIGLLMSYSRMAITFFMIIYIIYLGFIKKDKVRYIYISLINLLLVIIYMKIFEILNKQEEFLILYVITILFFVLSMLLSNLIEGFIKKLERIQGRTYIKILIFIIMICTILFLVGTRLYKPLNIFEDGQNNEEIRYNFYNIEPNMKYKFIFDIEAKSINEIVENFKIEIVEENKNYDTVGIHEISFSNFQGIKTIEFITSKDTESVVVFFKSASKVAQRGLTINKFYINEKEYALDYLFLPVKIVYRIENLFNEDKSAWERITYYKDALKICKENWLLGTGGNGWIYNYKKVQSYEYSTSETHSYLLKIIVENGMISGFLWLVIIGYAIFKIISKYRKEKLNSIDFAFLLLIIHSFVDFDLSFYVILFMWFVLYCFVIEE